MSELVITDLDGRQGPAPLGFPALLAPLSVEEFVSAYWLKSYCHIRGSPGKFAKMLPWGSLNKILEQDRLEPPRLELLFEGKLVEPGAYMEYRYSGPRRIPRVLVKELTAKLRQGATLRVNWVDHLYEPLTELAESFERFFHAAAWINAYAAWRTSPGGGLHWDDHEVFVLQLAGRKRWMIYDSSQAGPLSEQGAGRKELPPGAIWDNILEEGDLLYIPRGWWHLAIALDEPSLHVTVGVSNPTGIDLLLWLVDELRANDITQVDLPFFSDTLGRASYLDQLQSALLGIWGPDLLERYFQSRDAITKPRSHFSLPWSAAPEGVPPGEDFYVRLTTLRPLVLESRQGERALEFECNGRRWRFPKQMRCILEALKDGEQRSLAQLLRMAGSIVDKETVRSFVAMLVKQGLASVVDNTSHKQQ